MTTSEEFLLEEITTKHMAPSWVSTSSTYSSMKHIRQFKLVIVNFKQKKRSRECDVCESNS